MKLRRFVFGDIVARDEVSFEIRAGEIFGFIGPNGAGKTTTIRILSTLLDPTSGSAWVDGHNVSEEPEIVRRLIGYMPDDFGVYQGITVWEYLDFFAGAYRIPSVRRTAVIDGVLELTDLTQQRDRMVASLSKGMKQRLCLAKTLIHDPKVLILDEPASAMDPRARIELRELLKELRAMGKTILISSHILTELSDISTAYGIIERGKILEWGSMQRVKNRLKTVTGVHMRFHASTPQAVELLETLPDARNVSSEDHTVHFDYIGEAEDFHEILRLLVDRKLPLLTVERSDLESLFLEVTRGELQ